MLEGNPVVVGSGGFTHWPGNSKHQKIGEKEVDLSEVKHQNFGVMGKSPPSDPLSRRERQIMDAVFSLSEASVAEIRKSISDPPSENAVRTLVQILEEKGQKGI